MFFLVPVNTTDIARDCKMWTVNKYTCPFLLCSRRRIKFCCTRQVCVLAWCIILQSLFERNVQFGCSADNLLIWYEQKPRSAVLRKARLFTCFISYHADYQVYLFGVSWRQSAATTSKPLRDRCSPSDWAFPALFYPCCNVCWTVKQRGEDQLGRPYHLLHQCLPYFFLVLVQLSHISLL